MGILTPTSGVEHKRVAWIHAACASFAVCTALVGCNPSGPVTYPAGGRVLFPDKSPLTSGNIEFAPVEGEVKASARGMIEQDGTFRLSTFSEADGAIEGRHRVLIIPGRARGERPGAQKPTLHGKYQSFDTSGLEATVSADGPNNFEFVVDPAS
jgi:hypothetical protein